MKKVGIFVDLSNLYFCVADYRKGRKIDYEKYWNWCKDLGEIVQGIAYGAAVENEAVEFIHRLKAVGFITKFKTPKEYPGRNGGIKRKADWDVGITVDVVDRINTLDIIVLGTADGDLAPLIEWCTRQSKTVIVLAQGISSELKEVSTKAVEIPESLLLEAS